MLPEDKWSVREEKPVELGLFWKPQPDVAVVRGVLRDYIARTPGPSDIALMIEVSDTTYAKDTKIKLRGYERCGLPYYWIVDLNRRRVEVREMGTRGLAVPVFYKDNESVPVVLDGREYGRIDVRDLLP
jgi:Uma2 family endonuclease